MADSDRDDDKSPPAFGSDRMVQDEWVMRSGGGGDDPVRVQVVGAELLELARANGAEDLAFYEAPPPYPHHEQKEAKVLPPGGWYKTDLVSDQAVAVFGLLLHHLEQRTVPEFFIEGEPRGTAGVVIAEYARLLEPAFRERLQRPTFQLIPSCFFLGPHLKPGLDVGALTKIGMRGAADRLSEYERCEDFSAVKRVSLVYPLSLDAHLRKPDGQDPCTAAACLGKLLPCHWIAASNGNVGIVEECGRQGLSLHDGKGPGAGGGAGPAPVQLFADLCNRFLGQRLLTDICMVDPLASSPRSCASRRWIASDCRRRRRATRVSWRASRGPCKRSSRWTPPTASSRRGRR